MKDHNYQWNLLGKVPGCHKWFYGIRPDGRRGISAADHSGYYPDETDDGPLWLRGPFALADRKPEKGESPSNITVDIDVEDDNGKLLELGGTNLSELLYLDSKALISILYGEPPLDQPWRVDHV